MMNVTANGSINTMNQELRIIAPKFLVAGGMSAGTFITSCAFHGGDGTTITGTTHMTRTDLQAMGGMNVTIHASFASVYIYNIVHEDTLDVMGRVRLSAETRSSTFGHPHGSRSVPPH
mmetsp:Transcript_26076/g.62825  ORF Transcript_26076/g.62825 Transcript_26076/m.62825 type:complete len:118 (+) Transcript_26076:337-690(+)